MTRTACHPSHVRLGAWALYTLSHARARSLRGGKLGAVRFAEAPDGGVFGSEVLPRDWCVTELATLTRILTLTA